jgi:hypothetical protein
MLQICIWWSSSGWCLSSGKTCFLLFPWKEALPRVAEEVNTGTKNFQFHIVVPEQWFSTVILFHLDFIIDYVGSTNVPSDPKFLRGYLKARGSTKKKKKEPGTRRELADFSFVYGNWTAYLFHAFYFFC